MNLVKGGGWGLRILALILAIIIYNTLKNGSARNENHNDRPLFQSR